MITEQKRETEDGSSEQSKYKKLKLPALRPPPPPPQYRCFIWLLSFSEETESIVPLEALISNFEN
ncbi:hypothetical protein J1N35_010694 [Gossypium stocksii]|uniref:Uncharacterized protein n=1 Tax=Gossypium stocksii TaxID=47602 RepID=A0A9D3W0I7_9ROSI|nr:hypothetical protein J1N35_010694 [Gossypium stocksii]